MSVYVCVSVCVCVKQMHGLKLFNIGFSAVRRQNTDFPFSNH